MKKEPRESLSEKSAGTKYLFQSLLVLLDTDAAKKDGRLEVGHVFGKPFVFFGDLKGQFSCVAKNENGYLTLDRLQLLKSCQDENRSFSHS